MTPASTHDSTNARARELLDPSAVGRIIVDALPELWSTAGQPLDVRIERCWPLGEVSFAYEWTFIRDGESGRRVSLFGVWGPGRYPSAHQASEHSPHWRNGQAWGVSLRLPHLGLLIHTLDRDPLLPHLAQCLDGQAVASHIDALLASCGNDRAGRLNGRAISYRATRRAAIAYHSPGRASREPLFFGKAYRNGRGGRLAPLHREINHQLAYSTGGRVRVPVPLGHVPELHLAMYWWSRGHSLESAARQPEAALHTAVNALSALHRTWLPELADFTAQDECAIVHRWFGVLQRLKPDLADQAQPLVDSLTALAGLVHPVGSRTVHRDFYPEQLLVGRRATTILDLDTLAKGDPHVDLGNYLAHVFLAMAGAGAGPARFDHAQEVVKDRYCSLGGTVDRRNMSFYLASALFRVGAVHALRTATRRATACLWRQAAAELHGADVLVSERRSLSVQKDTQRAAAGTEART